MRICQLALETETVLLAEQAKRSDLLEFVAKEFSQKLHPVSNMNRTFIIKPNLGFMTSSKGGTTGPQLLEAVLNKIASEYRPADLFVLETDDIAFRCREVFDNLGLHPLVDKYGARLLNLSEEPYEWRRLDRSVALNQIRVPEYMSGGDFVLVNLAKAKTHEIARYSGAIKNLFGLNPNVFKLEYHRNIDRVLQDIYHVFRTAVIIVEGIWSIDGHGPWTGTPVRTEFLGGSTDALAADLVSLGQLGIQREQVPYLNALATEQEVALPDQLASEAVLRLKWVEASGLSRIKEWLAWLLRQRPAPPDQRHARWRPNRIAMAVVSLLATIFLGEPYPSRLGVAAPGATWNPQQVLRDLYEFAAGLPKDAVVAGNL